MHGLYPIVSRLTLRAAMGYTGNVVKSVNKDLVLELLDNLLGWIENREY